MKKKELVGVTPFLPEEIITNILKRLPVKSLIQFQCVCKHWKNLIKTPSFITDHLHLSSNKNTSLLFKRSTDNEPCALNLFVLDCEMQVLHIPEPPFMRGLCRASIIGSSNGLICGRFVSSAFSCASLFLWNPATRQVRWVPGAINDDEGDFYFGFGFGPMVNDYKIVKVLVNSYDHVTNRAEVYSLNTNSWKEIEFGNLEGVQLVWDNVNTNGSIFWPAIKLGVEEGKGDPDIIVSFDIAMEVFSLMPWPVLDSPHTHVQLTVYDNKFALLFRMKNFELYTIDLWVMEESTSSSRNRWRWTKKYSSSPYPVILIPLIIWRNEVVSYVVAMPGLVRSTPEPETVIYSSNLSTTEGQILTICRGSFFHYVSNYVESLVPVGNIHIE